MIQQHIILRRLLKKYENSKHLTQPGMSRRRVLLNIDKKELPEYQYETATIRDDFNHAATELEALGLVTIEWLSSGRIMQKIVLNLPEADRAYAMLRIDSPAQSAIRFCGMIEEAMKPVRTTWIRQWAQALCNRMRQTLKPADICKQGEQYVADLLRAFVFYDGLQERTITLRAFSAACYHDTKKFERQYLDSFLKIAESFHPELSEICAQRKLGHREQLSLLGIYARSELYELAGQFAIITQTGYCDLSSLYPDGIALPSTSINKIQSFDFKKIVVVMFIENKTNYDEYLITEMIPTTMVIFHGGFLSPQKKEFIRKLVSFAPAHVKFYFWADIDLGGFQMFYRLKKLVPGLNAFRMSDKDVKQFSGYGLTRDENYFKKMSCFLVNNDYPIFNNTIAEILKHRVTIEQEIFLYHRTSLDET